MEIDLSSVYLVVYGAILQRVKLRVCMALDILNGTLLKLGTILGKHRTIKKLHVYWSKKEGKNQESIQLSTTPHPGYQWECDKVTTRHHKREPRDQPFPSR